MIFDNESTAVIVNSFGDQYFHDVNGSAFNKVGSAALYKQHFADALLEENSLYVLLGSDSALLPKYLQEVGLPDGSRYIFVELPEVLDRLAEVTPEEGFDSRIILTTPEDWMARAVEFEFQNYIYLGRMEFHRSVGAEDLHQDGYQETGRLLQEELEQLRWMLSAEMGNELFNLRQLENLPENRLPASCLEKTFPGRTAVILGGGPSLDRSLSWISEQRDSLVVIAVSRIAKRLLEVGLIPDIILSIDPHQLSFDISKEMLLMWEKTIFIHQHHVSSKLLGQWRGRNFYLGDRFDWPTALNDEKLTARGPTVTNCGIDLAVKMGFSRLLLTGVDLCFNKDGFTHAQGSNEHQAGPQLGQGQLWVETNGGLMAETTADFSFAITTIAEQAGSAKQQECLFFSLSEEAAKIDNVDFILPEDLTLEPLPKSAFDMFQDLLPEENPAVRTAYLNEVLKELNRAIGTFREIKDLTEEGIKANEYFFGRHDKAKGNPKYRNKLDKIEKKLKNNFPDFTHLLKRVGIKDFLKMTHGEQDHQLWDDKDVERLGRIYYESYRDSAKRLLEMTKTARDRVLSRLEEEKECPDFKGLLEQWKKDEQPGRALVWKLRHPDTKIPEEFVPSFEQLAAEFNQVLEETNTLHMARAKAWSQLGPVCGKLKLMYKRGEKESLQHLLDSLKTLESDEAKALYSLGCGFLGELDSAYDAALENYEQVIDLLIEEKKGTVLEEALLRVFALSLERVDPENALLAAECLAGFSPAYLPYYADMLRLAGDKVSALDVYADYLERVKTDISVMLKLGRLYLELDVEEGARLMFDAVLEQEPWNQAALHFLETLDNAAEANP